MSHLERFSATPVALHGYPELAVARADHTHPRRQEIEQFICQRYWLTFTACLTHLPEQLIYLSNRAGELVAACALTSAMASHDQDGPQLQQLFSEVYLAAPAEITLSAAYHTSIERSQVLEVGSMACLNHHYLAPLFSAVLQVTAASGTDYLIFTATSPLRRHLRRMKLPSIVLTDAPQAALPTTAQGQWGHYYARQPLVVAGRVADGECFLTEQHV